ncbi:MAG: NeuD/PglB/VioB family sugar acetyltransferase [Mariprofundales bacterium]|nr:NeuD/PglB/VioB family sugar acetyltransferase [Mariprofundales bacterium]
MTVGSRWRRVVVSCRRLVSWGGADQCRVNYPILTQLGCELVALVDDTPDMNSPFKGVPIYIGEHGLDALLDIVNGEELGFVVAIGNPYGHVRMLRHALLKKRGLVPVSFADPTALICNTACYGDGLQVMPGAIIHNDVTIGTQCIINTRALVEHDCVLHSGVEIGPGAVLCGRVCVGKHSWIGANATVRPRINIGDNVIVGAGAVVVTDIPSNVVVAGVPAKVIRENDINV